MAGCLMALTLRQALPRDLRISVIDSGDDHEDDVFYGTVTSPAFYDFLLSLGLSEPDLLQATQATFSLGTHYSKWGEHNLSWMQSYFVTAPSFENVGLHHVLARLGEDNIEPYILSSVMAEQGVFAHPPEQGDTPLKNIEYGYHFLPGRVRSLAKRVLTARGVDFVEAKLTSVDHNSDVIMGVKLSNGETVKADIYVDAAQQGGALNTHSEWQSFRKNKLRASQNITQSGNVDGVCRRVKGHDKGWSESSPLQGENVNTDYQYCEANVVPQGPSIKLGSLSKAWTGNCVSIGLSASALEPITAAPIMLLQKDIERLLELFPIDVDMNVERSEYNRRFAADVDHAQMFTDMFWHDRTIDQNTGDNSEYQQRSRQKLEQFTERGVLVRYDYEPFNSEDWLQLYLGLGFRPKRYDRLADGISLSQLRSQLEQIKTGNAALVKRIPPHGLYLKKLLEFLEKRHG